jgi:hypothetical protein
MIASLQNPNHFLRVHHDVVRLSIQASCRGLRNQVKLGDIQHASQHAHVVGLWVFAPVFKMSNGVAADAGHIGKLAEAEAPALSQHAKMGQAMWLCATLFS